MPSSASSRKTTKTEATSTALEVLGALIVALALGIVQIWLGLAALGVECILAGLALSLGSPAPADPPDPYGA